MAHISPFYGTCAYFVSVYPDGGSYPDVGEIEATCSARMRGRPASAFFAYDGERPGERVYKITFEWTEPPTADAAGRSG